MCKQTGGSRRRARPGAITFAALMLIFGCSRKFEQMETPSLLCHLRVGVLPYLLEQTGPVVIQKRTATPAE